MADFICIAMAPQYTDPHESEPRAPHPSSSTSFRRSLNLSQGASALLGRRFSRSNHQTRSNSTDNNERSPTSRCNSDPVYIRIVPSIDNPGRSLVFPIIERELEVGSVVKIGRFTDRSQTSNHISFKSKVVSRSHCEFWVDADHKLHLRDTKSSSGTFVNRMRLSSAGQESRPTEIKDGDIIQLGVDYQGGVEEIYRSVKMRFELNRSPTRQGPDSFSVSAFHNLRNITNPIASSCSKPTAHGEASDACCPSLSPENGSFNDLQVDECVICLYALAPFQALFVAPCSHSYHFKCIRPLLQSYPGFQCPICRTYSDLEASVAIEAEEVLEKYGVKSKSSTQPSSPSSPSSHTTSQQADHDPQSLLMQPCASQPSSPGSVEEPDQQQPDPSETRAENSTSVAQPMPSEANTGQPHRGPDPLSTTLVASPPSFSPLSSSTYHRTSAEAGDHGATLLFEDFSNVITEEESGIASTPSSPRSLDEDVVSRSTTRSSERRLSASNLVEKLKVAFSEKCKSSGFNNRDGKRSSAKLRHRSQEEDADIMEVDDISGPSSPRPSSAPLTQTLSRQSTTHTSQLPEIVEDVAAEEGQPFYPQASSMIIDHHY
ncbi:uncharacterized protein BYT42DRAFT_562532 [Radiomyces spectabilis]|uniref:uncharacterized protein n=1 Tax=Radiomyces spectabilis TaxID=64574 RepID=UPI0022212541|nr:uncharacterized protein BYT42DRAFT_562532 [Radiomyces spectabilis]KAI8384431.1 hypothetical protein BYT42DRAFT_562532 [Radiomyces spectabilis]